MKTRVLLTTTSFQDTPGPHHELLASGGFEIVRERGPLSEARMLELMGDFDGLLCGDDAITAAVIDKARPRLRVISKYGIGLDKIDVAYTEKVGLPLAFCPGVNHTTVAEHAFALMLALVRNLVEEVNHTRAGRWKRITGNELFGKTLGIVGLGRIGQEMAKRARAFGMPILGFGNYWPEELAAELGIVRCASEAELIARSDVVSLHSKLTAATRDLIDAAAIETMRPGAIVINCARGEMVNTADMVAALESGRLAGYGADVLDAEPPPTDHPLLSAPRCVITPHIGSRTHESVARQATMAVRNLLNFFAGKPAEAQANKAPWPVKF